MTFFEALSSSFVFGMLLNTLSALFHSVTSMQIAIYSKILNPGAVCNCLSILGRAFPTLQMLLLQTSRFYFMWRCSVVEAWCKVICCVAQLNT